MWTIILSFHGETHTPLIQNESCLLRRIIVLNNLLKNNGEHERQY